MEQNRRQPKISIVVPVYNTEAYLPACVETLLRQTHTNLELIFVDDGSTVSSESTNPI